MRALEALQATLRAEHAAVYVLGVLGARADGGADADLARTVREAYAQHAGRRDELARRVRRAGGTPAVAAVAYAVPSPLGTPRQVRAAAREVERRAARSYARQAGATTGGNRVWAVDALTAAAVRQLALGGSAEDYPGLPPTAS